MGRYFICHLRPIGNFSTALLQKCAPSVADWTPLEGKLVAPLHPQVLFVFDQEASTSNREIRDDGNRTTNAFY